MRPDEMRDAGALTSTALGEVAEVARDMHRAIARRLFDLAGPVAEPVRLMHDGIAAIAHGSTRLGVRTLPAAAGLVGSVVQDESAPSAHDSRRGRFVLGALNGFWGDRIAAERDALAPQMRIRTHEGELRRVPANVAFDLRDSATGRIVLFLHGLCESDLCWSYAAEKRWGEGRTTYGSKLRADDRWTPLYVNYNSGLHISENGRELDLLVDGLVGQWPVHVDEIAVVGHSMGGLVARSAVHQAHDRGADWVRRTSHVVGLGAPHTGAPLERFANWGTHRLARHPETLPLARWLNRRSVGIKDLRYGAFVEADWCDCDPDELLTDRCTPAELVPGVQYSMVCATLSRAPEGIFAHDLLVTHTSAHGMGKTRTIAFDPERAFHLGGRKHHFDLLADTQVYEHLRAWLTPRLADS